MEVVTTLARVAGKEPELVRVPREVIVRNGGNAMAEPMYFGQYYDLPPITEAISRVKRVLNLTLTPFATGLKETHRWYSRNHPKGKRLNFRFEERLIKESLSRI